MVFGAVGSSKKKFEGFVCGLKAPLGMAFPMLEIVRYNSLKFAFPFGYGLDRRCSIGDERANPLRVIRRKKKPAKRTIACPNRLFQQVCPGFHHAAQSQTVPLPALSSKGTVHFENRIRTGRLADQW